ncbi:MAG TPA: hypothetical protein VD816_06515 [Ohtaekwangia sp.]|nr:hypothetical protein [Ohtaekwangia sp.]
MKSSSTANAANSYLKQFQLAQINLAKLIEEERLRKRMKSSRKRLTNA